MILKGHLRIFALELLDKESMSGYTLMKKLGEEIGTKPSPGSIYPLLDTLQNERLVSCRQDGKRKMYSITKKGKDKFAQVIKSKCELMNKVEKMHKIMSCTKSPQHKEIMRHMEKSRSIPLKGVHMEMERFMHTMVAKITEKKHKNVHQIQKKIKAIIKDATKKLKEL